MEGDKNVERRPTSLECVGWGWGAGGWSSDAASPKPSFEVAFDSVCLRTSLLLTSPSHPLLVTIKKYVWDHLLNENRRELERGGGYFFPPPPLHLSPSFPPMSSFSSPDMLALELTREVKIKDGRHNYMNIVLSECVAC